MNPRYFVRYKNLKSWNNDPIEVSFGRFYDPEAAEYRAKQAYDVEGYGELISVRRETATEARIYAVSRFLTRAFRVGCGAGIAFFVFTVLSDSGGGIGDVAFSSLTLNMVVSGLFKIALYIGAACLCWYIAFGPGTDH